MPLKAGLYSAGKQMNQEMSRERELKYLTGTSEPPELPHGWIIGQERKIEQILDTYLDHDSALQARGWALRRRETAGAPTRYTLKRNTEQTGAFHQRDELEYVSAQIPAEIEREIGAPLAAQLRTLVEIRQRRRSWPLSVDGSEVGVLSTDEIESGLAHWIELEVEFSPSLSDVAASELAARLQEFFAGSEGLTPSPASKLATAIAAR